MSLLAPTLEAFFTQRLIFQKNASPHTVASYRDCWRMLLVYVHDRTGRPPSKLVFDDLDAPMIGAFLDHLEHERGTSIASCNTRLAAVRSFFGFAALCHPEHAALIGRTLAIPPKRGERALVCFLTTAEADALLASPDRSRWTGRRDHALLLLAVQTGMRVSELTGLRIRDLELGTGAHVRCHGKGRKDRSTPLTRQTVAVVRVYLAERGGEPKTRSSRPERLCARQRCRPAAGRAARGRGRTALPLPRLQETQSPRPEAHLRDEDAGVRH